MAEEPEAAPSLAAVPPPAPGTTPEAQAMASVAAAVTGPGTPSSAAVTSTPDNRLVWSLVLAGPAVSGMFMLVVLFIAAPPWRLWKWVLFSGWPDRVAEMRVQALGGLAIGLALILAVIVFRLASGGLKSVSAKAGPAGIDINTAG